MCKNHELDFPSPAKETANWRHLSTWGKLHDNNAPSTPPDFDPVRKGLAAANNNHFYAPHRSIIALSSPGEDCGDVSKYPGIIGTSPALRSTLDLVSKVAATNCSVLLLGETGTGKELIANAIHYNSPRKNKPMIRVNCAALPPTLIESELFGHERGSFTGAIDRRIGKFELADNSTLFLDEIGEMPLEMQVKLLRALQEREIERIGGRSTIKVNVRIIAATNRNLKNEVTEGRFREDLYYRLNVFPISLPALRERRHDIMLLASAFIKRFAAKSGKRIDGICNQVLQELTNHNWPGNIRELEHQIERSVILCTGHTLEKIYLPQTISPLVYHPETNIIRPLKTLEESECDHIRNIIKQCGGRIGGHLGAAELLGVPASTLFSKMKKLGIGKIH